MSISEFVYVEGVLGETELGADGAVVSGAGHVVRLDMVPEVGAVRGLEPAHGALPQTRAALQHQAVDAL